MAKKVRNPVARFYYKGSHTHHVRRTVVVIEETSKWLRGYELREGSIVRSLKEAGQFVKTYRKSRIARYGDYSRLRMSRSTYRKDASETTLRREPVVALVRKGA